MSQYARPKVRTPYTDLSPITRNLCEQLEDWEAVYVGGSEWSYTNFLQDLWDKHEDVIIVEHDIVFWPGAIDALWDCKEEWCFYGYDTNRPLFPYLGCTKITPRLMDKALNCWGEQRRIKNWIERPNQPPWSWCDGWLWLSVGKLEGHLHTPGVVNANRAAWEPCKKCGKNHAEYSQCQS
jgi:hypothetical protein